MTDDASAITSKVEIAGGWLARNRNAVSGPLLPYLRRTFDLTSLQAIEASKLAHRLEYEGLASGPQAQ